MPDPKHVDVPEEAVEALAERRWDRGWRDPSSTAMWEEAKDRGLPGVERARAEARSDLQAAAPIIASKAVEEAERERDQALKQAWEAEKRIVELSDLLEAERSDPGKITRAEEFAAGLRAGRDKAVEEERERLREAEAILRECESPDGFCGEMPDDLRDRIETFNRAECDCGAKCNPGQIYCPSCLDQNGDDDV